MTTVAQEGGAAMTDDAEIQAKLQEMVRFIETANADVLCGAIVSLALQKGEMNEKVRRHILKTVALRLAARVMDPAFLVE